MPAVASNFSLAAAGVTSASAAYSAAGVTSSSTADALIGIASASTADIPAGVANRFSSQRCLQMPYLALPAFPSQHASTAAALYIF